MHQGSELVPCDFLVSVRGASGLEEHDDALLANALAQAEALEAQAVAFDSTPPRIPMITGITRTTMMMTTMTMMIDDDD